MTDETPPPPDIDWKGMLMSKPAANMLLAMLVKFLKVDVPVRPLRIAFGIAMLAHAMLLTMQLWAIRRSKDGPEIKVKELDMTSEKGFVEKTYTHKKYDDKQANQQIKALGMQMVITTAIHIMARMSTPLLLACSQPFFQLLDPVFRSRVLGHQVDVKRPSPDPLQDTQIRKLEAKAREQELDDQHDVRTAARANAKARKAAGKARAAIAQADEPVAAAAPGTKKDE